MSTFHIVTHNDLDGVGCEIIMRKVIKHYLPNFEIKIYEATYRDVNEIIKDIVKNIKLSDHLIITDLSVNEEIAELLNNLYKNIELGLVDHHKTALWLNKYDWAEVHTEFCATRLLYENLELDISEYEEFAIIVDDYDRWQHHYPESKELNMLFGLLGREKFVDRMMSNSSVQLDYIEQNLIDIEKRRIKKYCEKKNNEVEYIPSKDIYYTLAENYHSEVGNYILKNNKYIDCIFIIDTSNKKVSIRSKENFDASEIAKAMGGGGHPQACGYQINKYKLDNYVLDILPPSKTMKLKQ